MPYLLRVHRGESFRLVSPEEQGQATALTAGTDERGDYFLVESDKPIELVPAKVKKPLGWFPWWRS